MAIATQARPQRSQRAPEVLPGRRYLRWMPYDLAAIVVRTTALQEVPLRLTDPAALRSVAAILLPRDRRCPPPKRPDA